VGRGDDVVSIVAIDPKATDEEVLSLALRDERILVTEDKDFGELIFVRRLPHGPIVRMVELTVSEQLQAMRELLDEQANDLQGRVIVTIGRSRVRVRRTF
jgi:predicted nuclease of predicted toxin-antitoxin system